MGISQPAKSTILAFEARCCAYSGVRCGDEEVAELESDDICAGLW